MKNLFSVLEDHKGLRTMKLAGFPGWCLVLFRATTDEAKQEKLR